jgi:hypothetical protein
MRGASSKRTVAAMMVLLIAAVIFPILLNYYIEHIHGKRKRRQIEEEAEEHERRAIKAVETALRVQRGHGPSHDLNEIVPKKRRRTPFHHERAKLAVHEDYFSPSPVFDDKQYERTFRITKFTTQTLLEIGAKADPFLTGESDATGKCGIDPLLKVIMALKQVAYGCPRAPFWTTCKCVSQLQELVSRNLRRSSQPMMHCKKYLQGK